MANALASIRVQATTNNNVATANQSDPMFIYTGAFLKQLLGIMNAEVAAGDYTKKRADGTTDTGKRLIVKSKAKTMFRGQEVDAERIQTIGISSKIEQAPDYVAEHLEEFYVGQSSSVAPEFDLMEGSKNDVLANLTIITFQETANGIAK